MRPALAIVTALSVASPALAQTGVMYLSHSKLSGEVVPGETIRFEMRLDWTGVHQILWVRGNVRATPDLGLVVESYPPSIGTMTFQWGGLHTKGTHVGGAVEDFQVSFTPAIYGGGFIVPSPSRVPLEGTFLSWDWTAPEVSEPTSVEFVFDPAQLEWAGVWGAPTYVNPIPASNLAIGLVSAPIVIDPSNLYCIADLTTTATPGQPGHGEPDGTLNSEDFFFYLAAFVAGDPRGDLTHTGIQGSAGFGVANGAITSDDFFYYLTIYSMGC